MLLDGTEQQDEIKWYEEKFGKVPLYDEVIGMIAKTSSERNGLLKEFFEPTEVDLEENRKLPTEAHRSIAELVKQGYIKVVVTTNFDRLLEQALDELNVQYQTVYHESDIEGMKPLAHADCTVLKIHGDYRDTRFKNITDELENYSEPLSAILNRIFDGYGLIVSGWSAEWDTALRDTIRSVKGRRYSWYWHSFSNEINEKAKELVSFRDANVIVDQEGADHFFKNLKENVENIAKVKQTNPENLLVKVNRLKKYLSNNKDIELTDLITEETKKVINIVKNMDANQNVDDEIVKQWVKEIEEVITPISVLMSIITYYKGSQYEQLIIETLERLTNLSEHNGRTTLLKLKEIPVQAVFYSVGIALVKNRDFRLLNNVLVKPQVRDRIYSTYDFTWYMSPRRGLHDAVRALESGQRYHLPFEVTFMQPFMERLFIENQLCLDRDEIISLYDIFEFLRATKHRYLGNDNYFSGCFGYRHDRRYLEKFLSEGAVQENWDVLQLFDNNKEKFFEALKLLTEDLNRQIYFSGNGLLTSYVGEEN
ncbi:SIR2 family protein [Bacillus daqingensis]|uniref:SIR2 family protein n=1 Tax=Bacillus daqingensis TaxID=872396 RepID=A0ABV9NV12_9BACI